MIEKIVKVISRNETIAIMGCSDTAKKYYEILKKINDNCQIIFLDNDGKKQNEGFCGKAVISPCDSTKLDIRLIIIASLRFYVEMKEQLIGLNYAESQILYVPEIMTFENNRLSSIMKKRIAKKELNFVVDLAEHCNLNCQCCDHFSPLAKPHFTDKNEFENDIKRMSLLFGGNGEGITHVDLEGGEPLLNPDVIDYIEIVHKHMPDTDIKIFTNGILLGEQQQEFWDVCRRHKVVLEITKYPIGFEYTEVEKIAEENRVKIEYYSGGKEVKTTNHKPLDLCGKQNKYDSFHKCYMGNGECTMLKHGRIYPCTLVPNIEHFNRYFDKNIEVCEKDSIDIYEAKTSEEILDFLANPVPACRYCKPNKWTGGHEWKTTTYQMNEWAE